MTTINLDALELASFHKLSQVLTWSDIHDSAVADSIEDWPSWPHGPFSEILGKGAGTNLTECFRFMARYYLDPDIIPEGQDLLKVQLECECQYEYGNHDYAAFSSIKDASQAITVDDFKLMDLSDPPISDWQHSTCIFGDGTDIVDWTFNDPSSFIRGNYVAFYLREDDDYNDNADAQISQFLIKGSTTPILKITYGYPSTKGYVFS